MMAHTLLLEGAGSKRFKDFTMRRQIMVGLALRDAFPVRNK